MDNEFLIRVVGGLFAIMNPFTNLPVFLSLVGGENAMAIRRAALNVTGLTAIMCAVVALGGDAVLKFFGIGIDDFRVAGGLVVLLIGLGMLNGHAVAAHHGTEKERAALSDLTQIAFYPMTFPILVGPGTITTILLFQGQATTEEQRLAVWLALAGVIVLIGVVFSLAGWIGKLMSETLRAIMTRLMGMILAAIAVEMIADGLKVLWPGLAG